MKTLTALFAFILIMPIAHAQSDSQKQRKLKEQYEKIQAQQGVLIKDIVAHKKTKRAKEKEIEKLKKQIEACRNNSDCDQEKITAYEKKIKELKEEIAELKLRIETYSDAHILLAKELHKIEAEYYEIEH